MSIYLTVVVPCYNEDSRKYTLSLRERLDILKASIDNLKRNPEVIFVDDGSSDNTFNVIIDYISEYDLRYWCVVKHKKNLGKGFALRSGIKCAKGKYIAYLDADLSTSPYHLCNLESKLSDDTCYIASRFSKDSVVSNDRNFIRKCLSKFTRQFVTFLFGLKISDSQCGFKVFPARQLKLAENFAVDSIWLLDIEFLYAMKIQGVVIKEFSIVWSNDEKDSRVKGLSSIIDSLVDLVALLLYKRQYKKLLTKV